MSYKPIYQQILNEVGFKTENQKDCFIISCDSDFVLNALILLSKKCIEYGSDKSVQLFFFAGCYYSMNLNHIITRIDEMYNTNGLYKGIINKCIQKGYPNRLRGYLGTYGYGFRISMVIDHYGFHFVYSSTAYDKFSFGSARGAGVKAMLFDFNNLSTNMQEFLLKICNRCTHCNGCTHGGKVKGGKDQNILIYYQNEEISVCPEWPTVLWKSLDMKTAENLFEFHDMQHKYNPTK